MKQQNQDIFTSRL